MKLKGIVKEAQWMCNPSVIFEGQSVEISRFVPSLFLFQRLEVLLSVLLSKLHVICAASFLRSLNWWQLRLMQLSGYPVQQLPEPFLTLNGLLPVEWILLKIGYL